jgi:hypothetical protein
VIRKGGKRARSGSFDVHPVFALRRERFILFFFGCTIQMEPNDTASSPEGGENTNADEFEFDAR